MRRIVILVGAIMLLGLTAGSASAHGPVAPAATSYLARIVSTPDGIQAKVIDGYVRLWMRTPARLTVIVPDYDGAPYLRFSPAGVEVNHNAPMFYFNQTPVAETPPAGLTRTTPPHWEPVTSGHSYEWHDGRLQDLSAQARPSRATNLGPWRIPLLVNGRRVFITGELFYAARPSIVWFWPIVVQLLCVLAAWRVRRPRLDWLIARAQALTALAALSVAALARGLHGRPGVPELQLVELALTLAFAVWSAHRVMFARAGYLAYFAIACVALWEGLNLVGILLNHYVLLALPAFPARIATVICCGAGLGILPFVFRLAETNSERPR